MLSRGWQLRIKPREIIHEKSPCCDVRCLHPLHHLHPGGSRISLTFRVPRAEATAHSILDQPSPNPQGKVRAPLSVSLLARLSTQIEQL